jgi:hypothetical protein
MNRKETGMITNHAFFKKHLVPRGSPRNKAKIPREMCNADFANHHTPRCDSVAVYESISNSTAERQSIADLDYEIDFIHNSRCSGSDISFYKRRFGG